MTPLERKLLKALELAERELDRLSDPNEDEPSPVLVDVRKTIASVRRTKRRTRSPGEAE